MTDDIFAKGMILLRNAYPSLEVKTTESMFFAWRLLLDDIDDEVFISAILVLCRSGRELYPGTSPVGIIREECEKLTSKQITPEEAWLQVLNCTKKSSKRPNLKGNAINRAIDSVGWDAIWWSFDNPQKRARLRRDFCKFFSVLQNKETLLSEYKTVKKMIDCKNLTLNLDDNCER